MFIASVANGQNSAGTIVYPPSKQFALPCLHQWEQISDIVASREEVVDLEHSPQHIEQAVRAGEGDAVDGVNIRWAVHGQCIGRLSWSAYLE